VLSLSDTEIRSKLYAFSASDGNMEQETAPATRDVSDIENLPAELLEQVLLYVVGDALPPIIKHRGSTTVYRCNDTNQDYVARSLSFRLTCRRFGALSWRALGHFIGETVFDIRSRRSVTNLAAVSGCRDLAPWIHKLTIASHQPDEGSPLYGDEAGEAARRNSVETQEDDASWYPGLWSCWPEECTYAASKDIIMLPQYEKDFHSNRSLLAATLKKFDNLKHVCDYHATNVLPSRYRNLFYDPKLAEQ
jgi:hypothetical protein